MSVTLSRRKLAAAGVLAAVVVGGGASIAAASGGGPTATASGAAAGQQEPDGETADGPDGAPGSEEEQDPALTGSVPAPAETAQGDGQEGPGSEDREQVALQALATLTPQQAEQAALAAVPGTVAETELDDENGYVVYGVEVAGADGTVTEVVIDAGNGAVLAQQAEEADDAGETPEQAEGPGGGQD